MAGVTQELTPAVVHYRKLDDPKADALDAQRERRATCVVRVSEISNAKTAREHNVRHASLGTASDYLVTKRNTGSLSRDAADNRSDLLPYVLRD